MKNKIKLPIILSASLMIFGCGTPQATNESASVKEAPQPKLNRVERGLEQTKNELTQLRNNLSESEVKVAQTYFQDGYDYYGLGKGAEPYIKTMEAAEAGDPLAQYKASLLLKYDEKVYIKGKLAHVFKKDHKKSVHFLKLSADAGHPLAIERLALIQAGVLKNEPGSSVIKVDPYKARDNLLRAYVLGYEEVIAYMHLVYRSPLSRSSKGINNPRELFNYSLMAIDYFNSKGKLSQFDESDRTLAYQTVIDFYKYGYYVKKDRVRADIIRLECGEKCS